QAQRLPDPATQEAARVVEALGRRGSIGVRVEHPEVDLRNAQVAADLYLVHADAVETRIFHLRQQQLVQQPGHFRPDAPRPSPLHALHRTRNLRALVALDLIADLHVVVVANADAALGARAHLVHVVL